jgi:dihydroorotase
MAAAGAVGFTDDGSGIQDAAVVREALRRCGALGLRLAEHCEVAALCEGGVMHRGAASERAGLPGIPSQAEADMVERDLLLAETLRRRVHFQHISAVESVDLIRRAKSRGVDVTAEVTPHHLALTDEDAAAGGPNCKMNPPLRSERDRQALIAGVVEGVLDIIATDHAPHTAEAKAKGFLKAPFGVIGLETALAVAWTTLVVPGRLTPLQLAGRMGLAPARAFGLTAGTLQPGAPADVTLFDPAREWTVEPERFLSRSRNTPFAGRRLIGLPVAVVTGGEVRRHADIR